MVCRATVFIDHFINFIYVYLKINMDGDEMVQAKQAFDRIATFHNVLIKHHHCDNSLFDSTIFKKDIACSSSTTFVCGVNAHLINSKAERAIRDSTDGVRTSLLHPVHR